MESTEKTILRYSKNIRRLYRAFKKEPSLQNKKLLLLYLDMISNAVRDLREEILCENSIC